MAARKRGEFCKNGHPNIPDNISPAGNCRPCVRDRMRKHRGGLKGDHQLRKTHCPQGHPYDDENTYRYRGTRQCKACRRVRCLESFHRHHDRGLARSAEWRARNRERHIANAKRWAKRNPAHANLISRIKKHRRRGSGALTAADWRQVLAMYGDRCLRCGATPVTIDHVIPTSRGGTNTIDNVQPLCLSCNTSKGTKTIDYRPQLAAA